jgi:transcriptional regulator with XRE-family HTH domain
MANEETLPSVVEDARRRYENCRETILAVMRHHAINQTQLAEAMGMSRQVVSDRLTGKAEISVWELDGIAAILGVPAEVLKTSPDEARQWILDHPRLSRPLIGTNRQRLSTNNRW